MALLANISARCCELVTEIAHEPARSLTAFMDGVDEVWMLDAFMDQPDSADARA